MWQTVKTKIGYSLGRPAPYQDFILDDNDKCNFFEMNFSFIMTRLPDMSSRTWCYIPACWSVIDSYLRSSVLKSKTMRDSFP